MKLECQMYGSPGSSFGILNLGSHEVRSKRSEVMKLEVGSHEVRSKKSEVMKLDVGSHEVRSRKS